MADQGFENKPKRYTKAILPEGPQKIKWLYHPLDGITNLKYKLLCFSTPNKNFFRENSTSF
jgi:hypothetical protein